MSLCEFANEEKVLTGCVVWLSSFQGTYGPLSPVGHISLEQVNSGRAGYCSVTKPTMRTLDSILSTGRGTQEATLQHTGVLLY